MSMRFIAALILALFCGGLAIANDNEWSRFRGTNGTGVLDVRNLNVFPSGEVLIEFDITLSSTLPKGTVVTNQSAVRLADNSFFASSDVPNVHGTARPDLPGDEDPPRVAHLRPGQPDSGSGVHRLRHVGQALHEIPPELVRSHLAGTPLEQRMRGVDDVEEGQRDSVT